VFMQGVTISFQPHNAVMFGQPLGTRIFTFRGTAQGIKECHTHFSDALSDTRYGQQQQQRPMVAVANDGQAKSAADCELPKQTQAFQVLLKQIDTAEEEVSVGILSCVTGLSSTQRWYPVQGSVQAAIEQVASPLKTPPPSITLPPGIKIDNSKRGGVESIDLMPETNGCRTAYVRFVDRHARRRVLDHDWDGRCVRAGCSRWC
jgi:hypothetical protein